MHTRVTLGMYFNIRKAQATRRFLILYIIVFICMNFIIHKQAFIHVNVFKNTYSHSDSTFLNA